jgi:hypothetical protein
MAGVAALIDKLLSRKKPAPSPATQTFNVYIWPTGISSQPALLKKCPESNPRTGGAVYIYFMWCHLHLLHVVSLTSPS